MKGKCKYFYQFFISLTLSISIRHIFEVLKQRQVFLQSFQSPQVMYVAGFTISITFINIVFLLIEIFFNFFCKPRGVFIINPCFVWNKVGKYIENSFVQNKHLFINVGIYKSSVPIKHFNCSSTKTSICILLEPGITKIRWWIMYFQVKYCKMIW